MNEDKIRAIVREEMQKNYRSGSPQIPPHFHNGNDNLAIPLQDILGSSVLPSVGDGVLSAKNIDIRVIQSKPPGQRNVVPTVPFLTISGDLGAEVLNFAGGDAYTGTAVVYKTGDSLQLWISHPSFNGGWRGVDLNLSIS